MNYLKKLSVAALLAFFCSTNSFAETLTVQAPTTVMQGATGVLVNIIIDTGANTAGASFTVTYDPAKLEYVGVTSSFFATFAGFNPPSVTVGDPAVTYTQGLVDNPSSGKVMLAAAQANNGTAGQQTLFALTFNVRSDATAGDTGVNVEASKITNASAGYSTETTIPMLVGIVGTTYPTVPVTNITSGTITIGSAIVDTDGDGIDDGWETTHFGNLTTATATSDFDKDGYTDKQEYLNGGIYDPKIYNLPGGPGFIDIGLLYTDEGTNGFRQWNKGAWTQIAATDPSSIVASGTHAYVKMANGLYEWNGSAWTKIHSAIPTNMVASTSGLYADFTGFGLYHWNSTSWKKIHSLHPSNLVASGSDLYVTFTNFGLYRWNGSKWAKLDTAIPIAMVASTSGLYADFAGSAGLKHWNGTAWTKIHSLHPSNMVASGSLYVTFTGFGLYRWNSSVWKKLDTPIPTAMVAGF